MVAARHLAAHTGDRRKSADFSENFRRGNGRAQNHDATGIGKFTDAGANATVVAHERAGSVSVGGRPVETSSLSNVTLHPFTSVLEVLNRSMLFLEARWT